MRVINDITSILGITGGAGGGGGIAPDEIAGLQLWLEASPANTGAVEGGTIATWTDLSAAGNDASQATEAARPTLQLINGVYVVRFDGTDDWMSFVGTVADIDTTTIIALAKLRTPATSYEALMTLSRQAMYAHLATAGEWGGFNGVEIGSGTAMSGNFEVLTELSRAFNDVDFVTDGTLVNNTNGTTYNARTPALGGAGAGSQHAAVDVHAIVVYDSALSTENREGVEAYYASKATMLNA